MERARLSHVDLSLRCLLVSFPFFFLRGAFLGWQSKGFNMKMISAFSALLVGLALFWEFGDKYFNHQVQQWENWG